MMHEEQALQEQNTNTGQKQNDRKIYLRFILLLLLSVIGGFLLGRGTRILQDLAGTDIAVVLDRIRLAMTYILPVLYLLLHLTVAIVSFTIYRKAKKRAAFWDGEDDEYIESVEAMLDIPMVMGNVMLILNCLLYTVLIYQTGYTDISQMHQSVLALSGTVLLLAGFAYEIFVQKLVVDLLKQLNPEKRGNVFELDFMKTWVASCDEAQKLNQYEATYHSFRATNIACMLLWLMCFIAMNTVHTGIFPSICVSVLWLVLVLSYSIAVWRLEHRKHRTDKRN